MKKCLIIDPAKLYEECWEYVVSCTMSNCVHLSREDAEDITSQAFLELMHNGKTNIQNWIWLSKMRGRMDYEKHFKRTQNVGLLSDIPECVEYKESYEVFKISSLLVRKDAKECLSLWLKGYNRTEIAKILKRHPVSVTTMIYRLRNQARNYLQKDIKIYHGEYLK